MKVQNKKELKGLIQKKGEGAFPDTFPDAFDFDEGNLFAQKTNESENKTASGTMLQRQAVKGGGADQTKTTQQSDKQNSQQQTTTTAKPTTKYTIYIYRLTTFTPHSYALTDKDLTDPALKTQVAPEIARIMNNNWLDSTTEVKVITQAVAETFTTDFLVKTNAAILPIVQSRFKENVEVTDYIGSSNTYESTGYIDPNPDFTYLNLARINLLAKADGLKPNYALAYIGAHEALHQLYNQALSKLNKWNPKKDPHSFGLNKDGQNVGATDFKQKVPAKLNYLNLKSMAEWIPFSIKQDLNSAAKK